MARKTCETCTYCRTDTAADLSIHSFCYFNPPTAIPVQTQKGMGFMTVGRPEVNPKKDFCKEHLEESVFKPH